MKIKLGVSLAIILCLTQACSTGNAPGAASPQEPINPPTAETSVPDMPQPIVETTMPEVSQSITGASTSVALSVLPTLTPSTEAVGSGSISENGIRLNDNGKTVNMKVGDSFLLNLGTDVYDWTVTVENESVLHLKIGVMVIRGAQGIYDALAPGTTTLSAIGNPTCLQANPSCARPSILFKVTVIVK